MTKLLEDTIARLRKMPDVVQDLAAQRLLQHVDELPEQSDLAAIAEGRSAFTSGELADLEQWRDDVELGDR